MKATKNTLVTIFYFSLILTVNVYASNPKPVCADLIASVTDESAQMEKQAIDALKNMQLTETEAKADVKSWVSAIQGKQTSGKKLSVMEHTALLHLLRSGFLEHVPDSVSEHEIREILARSWFEFTGTKTTLENITDKIIPANILKLATHREREFHRAVFRSSPGAASVRGEVDTGKSVSKIGQTAAALGLLAMGFSHAGGIPAGEALAGAVTGYTISALAEYLTHRFYLHPSKAFFGFLKKIGWTQGAVFHTGNHHGIFTEERYSTAENPEWQNAEKKDNGQFVIEKRDKTAEKGGFDPNDLHENQYGMSMNKKEITMATASTMSVAALVSYLYGFGPEGYAAAMAVAPLTAQTTAILHPYLHMPLEVAKKVGGPLISWLLSTKYWRDVSQYHYEHHASPKEKNFSLFLPGPDYIFNTQQRPSLQSLMKMDELGIPY